MDADNAAMYTNPNNKIDLRKIFTPATDSDNILPRNRTLFASSDFYSPTLHPTVEDQIAMARRISHSLSDISNQKSRGQIMYVNRRMRSAKWVHESTNTFNVETESSFREETAGHVCQGSEIRKKSFGQNNIELDSRKENDCSKQTTHSRHDDQSNVTLKMLMNPCGQVLDFNSARDTVNTESGLLSPNSCAEVVSGLQLHKCRGAELFEKRRKIADKWTVDGSKGNTSNDIDNNITTTSMLTFTNNLDQIDSKVGEKPLSTKDLVKKFQIQSNMNGENFNIAPKSIGATYLQSTKSMQNIKEQTKFNDNAAMDRSLAPGLTQANNMTTTPAAATKSPNDFTTSANLLQRMKAYEPSIPQGWNAPKITFPEQMYIPKEIPSAGYKPPSNKLEKSGNEDLLDTSDDSIVINEITPSPSAGKLVYFNLKKFVPYRNQAGQIPLSVWKNINYPNNEFNKDKDLSYTDF